MICTKALATWFRDFIGWRGVKRKSHMCNFWGLKQFPIISGGAINPSARVGGAVQL